MVRILRILLLFVVLLTPQLLYSQNWQWAKNVGGGIGTSSDSGTTTKIVTDQSGNSFVTGIFSGVASFGDIVLTSLGGNDVFVAKYDAAGNLVWAKSAGGAGADYANSIAIDASGNSYIVGYFFDNATFGSTNLTSDGPSDLFIAKYDANGNVVWAKKAGGTNSEYGQHISLDASGNIYVAGTFNNQTVFGNTTLVSKGPNEIFVAKLDASGNFLWARSGGSLETETLIGVGVDNNGNTYLTGRLHNEVTFGSVSIVRNNSTGTYLVKYDNRGNLLWAKDITEGTGNVQASAIAVDAVGNSYLTGLAFNSPTFGTSTLYDNGKFLAKFDTNGSPLWANNHSSANISATGITVDAGGNIYETGYFYNTVSLGSFTLSTNSTSYSVYVAKYLNNGTIVWATNFEGGSSNSRGIAIDAAGNSYVAGTFSHTIKFGNTTLSAISGNNSNLLFAKISANGSKIWVKSAGGTGADEGSGIVTDKSGNSYVTGFFAGSATFGATTLTSSGSEDVFITKYNTAGQVLWAKKAGGKGSDRGISIAVDASGNSYVAGTFYGTATFGGINLVANGLNREIFLAKYDGNGNVLWAKKAGENSNPLVNRGGISVDGQGNCYITGNFSGEITFGNTTLSSAFTDVGYSTGGSSMFLAKFDKNGNIAWATKSDRIAHNFSFTTGFSLAADAIGNCYVVGHFDQSVKFGNTTLTSTGGYDIFIVKYDASGNAIWAKSVNGKNSDYGQGIALDMQGFLYITGNYWEDATFGTTTFVNKGESDMFIAKMSTANGQFIWAKNGGGTGSDFGHGITTDDFGNSYVTGTFSNNAVFGSHTLTIPDDNRFSLFVTKYDTNGNAVWVQKPSSGVSQGRGIAIDVMGNSYVTGITNGAATFDATSLNSVRDILIAKLGNTIISTNALATTHCAGASLNVSFTSSGTFNSSNIFTVQLSDASGSFNNPINIGSGNSSPLSAYIPIEATGTAYRIRVIASSPYTIGSDNGEAVIINSIPAKPTLTKSGNELRANVEGTEYEWLFKGKTMQQKSQNITVSEIGEYKVRVKNQKGCFSEFSSPFQVTEIQTNSAPTAIALSRADLNENNVVGAVIGTLSSTDADAGDTHTYSLVTGEGSVDNTSFSIEGDALKAAQVFDYETKSSYSVRIRSTDRGGKIFEDIKVITINDVQETVTGIADEENAMLRLYPNPSRGYFMITLDTAIESVRLVDSRGSTVLTVKVNAAQVLLNIEGVATGVYTAIITSKDKVYSRRVVVSK